MDNTKRYPVIHPNIHTERIQPLFSQFNLEFDGVEYPIYVNPEAAQILRMCNGQRTIEEISQELAIIYADEYDNVLDVVESFLLEAQQHNHVGLLDQSRQLPPIRSVGSTDYWTPDLLSIELTHKCPLRCKHCFLSAGEGYTMDDRTLTDIINQAKDMHIAQIQLTGGEPLLHPRFFDALSECVANGSIVHVFTSGVICTSDIIDKFSQFDRKRVFFQISLDGLEEYHDMFRGVRGSFKKSCRFISEIAKLGFKVTVATTIDNQHKDELLTLFNMCKDLGVSVVRLSGISNRGRAVDNALSSAQNGLDNIIKLQKELAEHLDDDHFKIMLLEDTGHQDKVYLMNCGLGQTSIKIAPNGDVFACMMADSPHANIHHDTLIQIQKNKSRLFEKLTSPTAEKCKDCDHFAVCENCIIEGLMYCAKEKREWLRVNEHILHSIYGK